MQSNNSFSSNDMFDDYGVITIMYHRFEENKYPSTNIRINDFKTHLEILKEKKISFINANEFEKKLKENKKEKKVLITIDDAYLSFYKKAWPLLKKDKIPFILFVSTREVGKHNYMSWDQIREISKENFVHIGNHSHTHEYLIDLTPKEIEDDIKKSISIFKKEIGYNSQFFSYPFGEYSLKFKNIINDLGFKYAFGQHSGVSDETKDFLELPRFPLNEKYGKIDRFTSLLKTLPFKYESIVPNEKYINKKTNPPEIKIEFKKNIKNLNQVTCYSNEEDKWRKSNINFNKENILTIKLAGKFITERGRINCSLREGNGYWRWLGIQFVVAEK